ncbi:hypothetical protein [Ligilactobacillus salivarius]|uniref:Uncharacterized protein n=1 Tax=Ligilactobacillus salivarius TaxID=1624 RepID=A0A9X6S7H1_9LACO|nr:hypothetical protein [Ligilactobacillus salivarius]MBE7387598.1 hypothetical protein [Ligilactobacillus salivarius]MBE7391998.1 hypothetical protein [Ligilactobacillus salivarius]PAY25192.1 hypothetical protein A8C33_11295 [Ligilactobacillus salivarius]PAY25841.1 hypothetical protein A8C49_11355 [Ligilactobacillus salivarius]PAY27679.1 hypothetical protein A8C44_11245 [Ligilactobacillus salivarius]
MKTTEVLTPQEIIDLAENIINRYDLDYNNAEVELFENDVLAMIVEAPNHATIEVTVDLNNWVLEDKKIVQKIILRTIADEIRKFNADDEFDEFWSVDFGRHNGFRASEFIQMLQEDEAYFKECAVRMYKEAINLD